MKTWDHIYEREMPEPLEGIKPVPLAIVSLLLTVAIGGVSYYLLQVPGGVGILGDTRSPVQAKAAISDGPTLFKTNCSACHQLTGAGVPKAFPPLAGSEWVASDPAVVGRIVLYGVNGPIKVLGNSFNSQMPPFGERLKSAEIAAVLTYVRSQWGNQAGPITAAQLDELRQLEGKRKPWAGEAELRARVGKLAPP